MSDTNDFTFMSNKRDTNDYLYKHYENILWWGNEQERAKALRELKSSTVSNMMYDSDRQYMISKFENKCN